MKFIENICQKIYNKEIVKFLQLKIFIGGKRFMYNEIVNIESTVDRVFSHTVERRGDNIFIKDIDSNVEITWNQSRDMIDKLSKGFIKRGIKKGDHVMIWLPNSYKWVLFYLALARLGAVGVLVNTANKELEMDYLIKDSDCKFIIMCEEIKSINCKGIIKNLIPNAFQNEDNIIESSNYPNLKQIIFDYELESIIEDSVDIDDKTLKDMYNSVKSTDIVNILYTSGTTGDPKGVMVNQRSIFYSIIGAIEGMGLNEEETVGTSLPMFHNFGLYGLVVYPLIVGAKSVIMDGFSPSKFLKAVEAEKVALSMGVPTMYIAMMHYENLDNYNLSNHKKCLLGGAVCPPALVEGLSKDFKVEKVFVLYGLTESPSVTTTSLSDPYEKLTHSIGRPSRIYDVKIVDPETKEELPCNTVGEISVKGLGNMDGYYNKEEETKRCLNEEGWFYTGDLASMDEEGYLYICGRKKDMIKRGGEGIHPKEIESVLLKHEAIKDVQVVGVPSEKYGEEVMAYVILKNGYQLSEEDVKEYVKQRLAIYKTPRYVKFIEDFPCTITGKPQKFKLKEMAIEEFNL